MIALVSTRLAKLGAEFEDAVADQNLAIMENTVVSDSKDPLRVDFLEVDHYNLGWLAAFEEGLASVRRRQSEVAPWIVTMKSDKDFLVETILCLVAEEATCKAVFFMDEEANADFKQGRIDGLGGWLEGIDPIAARRLAVSPSSVYHAF